MASPLISIENVTLAYGPQTARQIILDQTSFRINQGDFVALVGPSGCGKSTILKMISGLLKPSAGAVLVKSREIGAVPIRIGMAFQNPTLLPWLSVRDNVMMPLKIVSPYREQYRSQRKSSFRARADAMLAQVGLAGQGDKRPWQLSGGMLQRASLCRALIHEPELLMLDEPFGALDQFTREELWTIMQDLWITRRPTVLLVTHDLKEAGYLANKIFVMQTKPGRIVQERGVDFPRPRSIDTTFSTDFTALTYELRAAIVAVRNAEKEPAR